MSVIKAGTTVTTALVLEGNTDGDLIFKTGSAAVTAMSISASGVVTFPATTGFDIASANITNLTSGTTSATVLRSASATLTNLLATTLTVSGVAVFPAGTATLPSITTTGDLNTGIYFSAADQVALTTGGTQRFLVNASGNVGIGISNPTYLLEMEGSAPRSTIRGTTNGSNVGYRLETKDSGGTQRYGGYYYQPQTGTNESYLGLSADDSGYQLGVKANGNVFLLGGATNVTGTGITFPATQSASSDANTLDDYEEGSWTPSWRGTGSNPTVSYNIQLGKYTKIGNLVYVTLRMDNASYSGGSGNLQIAGLPFTVANDTQFPGFPLGYKTGFVTIGPDYGRFSSNSTNAELWQDDNTTEIVLTVTNAGSSTSIILSGCYRI